MLGKPDERSREIDDLMGAKMSAMRGISILPHGE